MRGLEPHPKNYRSGRAADGSPGPVPVVLRDGVVHRTRVVLLWRQRYGSPSAADGCRTSGVRVGGRVREPKESLAFEARLTSRPCDGFRVPVTSIAAPRPG